MASNKDEMAKNKALIAGRVIILALGIMAIVGVFLTYPDTSWRIVLAMFGFSAIVFVHECGHFFVAKAVDIKVENFTIFLPPVLIGIRRTEKGFKVRILPTFFPKSNDPDDDGMLSFTFGPKGKAGDTEYRLGMIPVAGYVKMLGQADAGADTKSDDPRAYPNKKISARMAVVAAGVVCNVIAAIVLLVAVYMIGINQTPPVIGEIAAGSPAEKAGIIAGDEIIEIDGRTKDLIYYDVVMAAALSKNGQPVAMKIKHADGNVEKYNLVAEKIKSMPMSVRLFGFMPAASLEVGQLEPKASKGLLDKTGLMAGDVVTAVNGKLVKNHWQLNELLEKTYDKYAILTVERTGEAGEITAVETKVPVVWLFANGQNPDDVNNLSHVCSMVPMLKVLATVKNIELKEGDIIAAVADVEYPTYTQLRKITKEHENKKMVIKVLRSNDGYDQKITVEVQPKASGGSARVTIGIAVGLAAEKAVVADTIKTNDYQAKLDIPKGAVILAVDDVEIDSFYDMARLIKKADGKPVKIKYRHNEKVVTEQIKANSQNAIVISAAITETIGFVRLQRVYKATGIIDALDKSVTRSFLLITKTYVTLKGLVTRDVSPKAMGGPIAVAKMTYMAAEQSPVMLLYFLAFISVNLAVINFLPLPIVDGGVFVMLIIEKIKGSPINERVQEIITYAGLILLGVVFLYLTGNDVMNLFKW